MNDSISRQAAIDALDAICDRECEYTKKQRAVMCASCHLGSAFDVIDELPSAERHGKWIIYTVSPWDGEDVKCSVCGEKGCAPYWNYCPHCGAKMDGDTE